jgi:hypothetical protein
MKKARRKGQKTKTASCEMETEQSPDIRVQRGRVVGIGRLKVIPNQVFPWKIPTLSYVVIEMEPDYFVASCIQLWKDGYGDTPDSAVAQMKERCKKFLRTIFNGEYKVDAWENLYHRFKTDAVSDELRDAYYEAQLRLAQKGVSMGLETALEERINLLEKQISDTEDMLAKQKTLQEQVNRLSLGKRTLTGLAEWTSRQDAKALDDFDIEEETVRLAA